MEVMTTDTCRICLITGRLTVGIYDTFKKQYRLADMIEELLAEKVQSKFEQIYFF